MGFGEGGGVLTAGLSLVSVMAKAVVVVTALATGEVGTEEEGPVTLGLGDEGTEDVTETAVGDGGFWTVGAGTLGATGDEGTDAVPVKKGRNATAGPAGAVGSETVGGGAATGLNAGRARGAAGVGAGAVAGAGAGVGVGAGAAGTCAGSGAGARAGAAGAGAGDGAGAGAGGGAGAGAGVGAGGGGARNMDPKRNKGRAAIMGRSY